MIRRPPKSTRTDTLFPYTTLFLSRYVGARRLAVAHVADPDRCPRVEPGQKLPCVAHALFASRPLHLLALDGDDAIARLQARLRAAAVGGHAGNPYTGHLVWRQQDRKSTRLNSSH